MLVEDWRLHTELFGQVKFALFPVQILFFVSLTTALLTFTTISDGVIIGGAFALSVLFGAQTGGVVFEGRDAMENVLGDSTFLVFSSRTLPITTNKLLAVFLMKDLVYYSLMFILPVTIGLLPFYVLSTATITALEFAAVFAGLSLMFMFGAALMVVTVSVSNYGLPGKILVGSIVVALIIAWYNGVPVEQVTPYRVVNVSTVVDLVVGVGSVFTVSALGVLLYSNSSPPKRRATFQLYSWLTNLIPVSDRFIMAKTLVDIHRSSGSFLKVGLFAAILWAAAAGSLIAAKDTLGLEISPGLAFGSLLALTAFTSSVWVTQFDSNDEYSFHSVSTQDVFNAKFWAFAALTPLIFVVFYGGALLVFPTGAVDAVIGSLVFFGLSVYVFGLSVYLAGLDPHDFMFNTQAFSMFWVTAMIGVIPVLIVSFFPDPPVEYLFAMGAWSVAVFTVGVMLLRRAPVKWESHYRR